VSRRRRSLGRSVLPLDKAGRVKVERDLTIPGHPEVFVIGDLAILEQDGKPVTGLAAVAAQEGPHAAKNILRAIQASRSSRSTTSTRARSRRSGVRRPWRTSGA
jgi:NADH dehydrogenase FAD-containing subunit